MQTWRHTNRSLERMLWRTRPDHHHTDQLFIGRREGCFPSIFKNAHVRPLLKKPSLPPEDLNNYRPISNLNFISKILEKVVASRMNSHLSTNSLFLPFQSAYRSFHSTESTLLKIHTMTSFPPSTTVKLLLSFFLISLPHSALSIIRFCYPVSKIGLVLRIPVCHGFLRISTCANRRFHWKISSLPIPLYHVVFHKDPFSARFFSLSIRLLLAQLYPGILWNIICMLMTLNLSENRTDFWKKYRKPIQTSKTDTDPARVVSVLPKIFL